MNYFPKYIKVNEQIYLKNPDTSELGRKIITGSIDMIDEIGFERFNFRKLGIQIQSTEASIYRYFKNKHKLLLYLTSWYWAWMEYRLVLGTANIFDSKKRLERAITILIEKVEEDSNFSYINEPKLQSIIVCNSSKSYLTKEVDHENTEGAFAGYKQLVSRVSDIILEINAYYKYPHMLISTVIEGGHHQRFFAEHLPQLTDMLNGEDSITEFYKGIVFNTISKIK